MWEATVETEFLVSQRMETNLINLTRGSSTAQCALFKMDFSTGEKEGNRETSRESEHKRASMVSSNVNGVHLKMPVFVKKC